MEHYFIYCYYDNRKSGNYEFSDICFLYEPFYIGKGKYTERRKYSRVKQHLNEKRNRNFFKNGKINHIKEECGCIPFIEILYDNITEEEAILHEKELIAKIGRYNIGNGPLTNLTDGGEGSSGYIQSKETKDKRVESLKKSTLMETLKTEEYKNQLSKRTKEWWTSERRKEQSIKQQGENNSNFGKKRSLESIEKAKETKRKNIENGILPKITEESRRKMSESSKKRKGKKNSIIRKDSVIYILVSNIGETFEINGAVKLQDFCKIHKLQVKTLKRNLGLKITKEMIIGNKIFAKNTIGWALQKN
jgi:hypothetical protein